jgi:ribonucleoside-diphosphate reductase beta chain
MIVEGVLAETGYRGYGDMLEKNNLMPGMQQGIAYLKRDESRHIAYGIYLISRLVAQDSTLWSVVEERMNELLPLALGTIEELTSDTTDEDGTRPFGLQMMDYVIYATNQFQKRVARIERARAQTLEELYQLDEVES